MTREAFRWWVLLAATLVVILLVPRAASAQQTYRWTDERGHVHYSQGLDSVPVRQRATAVPVGSVSSPTPAAQPQAGAGPAGPGGSARIRFSPGQPIIVAARINSGGTAQLLLDTGASVTTINPAVLTALGVSFRDARRGAIKGVTGEANVLAVRVESIEVEGARFGPLLVVSHDSDLGFKVDGLLGRDFLDHFAVNIDNAQGIVTLTPK